MFIEATILHTAIWDTFWQTSYSSKALIKKVRVLSSCISVYLKMFSKQHGLYSIEWGGDYEMINWEVEESICDIVSDTILEYVWRDWEKPWPQSG